jgi:hypothetical protein
MEEHGDEYGAEKGTVEAGCPHYWLIEPPRGPTSMGICKLCGAIKEFDNQFSVQHGRPSQDGLENPKKELVVKE